MLRRWFAPQVSKRARPAPRSLPASCRPRESERREQSRGEQAGQEAGRTGTDNDRCERITLKVASDRARRWAANALVPGQLWQLEVEARGRSVANHWRKALVTAETPTCKRQQRVRSEHHRNAQKRGTLVRTQQTTRLQQRNADCVWRRLQGGAGRGTQTRVVRGAHEKDWTKSAAHSGWERIMRRFIHSSSCSTA